VLLSGIALAEHAGASGSISITLPVCLCTEEDVMFCEVARLGHLPQWEDRPAQKVVESIRFPTGTMF
jgi:hypothetical protein